LLFLNKTPHTIKFNQQIEPILFETIKIDNKPQNLTYHQERVDRAFKELFKSPTKLNLEAILKNHPTDKLYRAKVIYNKNGLIDLQYYPYKKKEINTIFLIELPNIDYSYKYLNRQIFDRLSSIYIANEFLITQNGLLTDTTIANIALYHSELKEWHTPKKPLLKGTTRERYLNLGKIKAVDIYHQNLKEYNKIAFLNAMVDWYEKKLEGS